ncbi:MAG: hypothetical protein NE327_11655 [Lentisphaeraceae bacterium]|nr:hypothetical protein [Lentisphaeraceae bacterium]
MLYAVIQEELKTLDPSEVASVYSEVYGLNKIDALAKVLLKPQGILAFGLDEEKAEYMAAKLNALNYTCRKQSIDSLLPIPDAFPIYSALFSEEGIVFENLFGEQKRILWNHLRMIEVFKVHNKSVSLHNRKASKRIGKPSTVTIKKEEITEGWYIEIFSDSPYPRLQIEATRFNYSSLGQSMDRDSLCNFEKLLSNIKSLCSKFSISFEDHSGTKFYSTVKEFENYSHWKLQQVEKGFDS